MSQQQMTDERMMHRFKQLNDHLNRIRLEVDAMGISFEQMVNEHLRASDGYPKTTGTDTNKRG